METQKHRKRNIIISVITGVVVILVGIGAWLFVDSARAVNEYVQAVDTQYNISHAPDDGGQPHQARPADGAGHIVFVQHNMHRHHNLHGNDENAG